MTMAYPRGTALERSAVRGAESTRSRARCCGSCAGADEVCAANAEICPAKATAARIASVMDFMTLSVNQVDRQRDRLAQLLQVHDERRRSELLDIGAPLQDEIARQNAVLQPGDARVVDVRR